MRPALVALVCASAAAASCPCGVLPAVAVAAAFAWREPIGDRGPAVVAPATAPAHAPAAAASGPFVGVVVPAREMDVAFAIPVTLRAVPVALGDRVRAGDVLAESEAAPYRHAAEGAWASLASAEAEADAARVAAEQARAALASAEALLAAGAVSEAEVVAASYGADAASAALASARARAAEQRAGARQRSSEVASRTITAPFDGVVTRRAADRGAVVPAGVAIVRVIDDREFRVRFGVDRATAGRLAVGDRVWLPIRRAARSRRAWTACRPRSTRTPSS